jgi:hypothetical protein
MTSGKTVGNLGTGELGFLYPDSPVPRISGYSEAIDVEILTLVDTSIKHFRRLYRFRIEAVDLKYRNCKPISLP